MNMKKRSITRYYSYIEQANELVFQRHLMSWFKTNRNLWISSKKKERQQNVKKEFFPHKNNWINIRSFVTHRRHYQIDLLIEKTKTRVMTTFFVTSPNQSRPSALKTILLAGLVAGTLDMLAAITIYSLVMNKITILRLLQGIARGAFGDSAFEEGSSMAIAGLGFHFIIAFAFAIFYFLVFPYIPFLKKQRIISGLLYGIFVWCVMNLAVLPLLHIAPI